MSSALTNADFRSLLNRSDQQALPELVQRKRKKTTAEGEARKNKYLQFRKRQRKQDDTTATEAGTEIIAGFSDRAHSRRQNLQEYAQIAEEFKVQKDRSVEESKFLGGDLEHTHLVKGLDLSLLSKVRNEIQNQAKPITAALSEHDSTRPEEVTKCSSFPTKKAVQRVCSELHPHHVEYASKLARIQKVLLQGARFKGNSHNFLPGRMRFAFNLTDPPLEEPEEADSAPRAASLRTSVARPRNDIPVAVFRSKEDCIQISGSNPGICGGSGLVAHVRTELLEELQHLVQSHHDKRRRQRQEAVDRITTRQ